MNNNTTAVEREKAGTTFNTTSEYKIGHTLYTVTTVFNPASKESLSDITFQVRYPMSVLP